MNIEEEAIAFCKGWSDNFYNGKKISRGEVTCILVGKQEQAIPIIQKIFDLNFKNRWDVPYIKTNSCILDGCLVAIGRLGKLANSLGYILTEYYDHPYHPRRYLNFIESDFINTETEIDIWFGADYGCGRKIKGKYIEPSDTPNRIDIQITDEEFLDMIGCENDPDPFVVSAYRLGEDQWVRYDDFAWSPKGEIQEKDLVDGELHGKDKFKYDTVL